MTKKKVKDKPVLVTEKRYEGQYVAFDPSMGKKIIASGRDPGTVIRKARKMGVSVPAIVFVPKQDLAYIY